LELRFIDKKKSHGDVSVEILKGSQKDLEYRVSKLQLIGASDIVDAKAGIDSVSNRPCVTCSLTSGARVKWARITSSNYGKQVAVVIDGIVVSTFTIAEQVHLFHLLQ